mmetsp:Transcript_20445/g.61565  ORF Transcript_20445/g.61565 Transcript_20445/m.61565 type:complete len:281 (-) Transcript_20445:1932-2774(-)
MEGCMRYCTLSMLADEGAPIWRRSKRERWSCSRCATMDFTVAGSCWGSPTSTSRLQPKVRGCRAAISEDWAASSMSTVWKRPQVPRSNTLRPVDDRVVNTISASATKLTSSESLTWRRLAPGCRLTTACTSCRRVRCRIALSRASCLWASTRAWWGSSASLASWSPCCSCPISRDSFSTSPWHCCSLAPCSAGGMSRYWLIRKSTHTARARSAMGASSDPTRTTDGRYTLPLPSMKPAFMTRCSSSSAAALEGAHTRIRGLGTSPGRLRSKADIICAVIS